MIYDKFPVVLLSAMAAEKSNSTNHSIASYILEHAEEIPDLSIKELAARCFVGIGSVSRFVRDIGLQDFAELKELIRDSEYHFDRHAEAADAETRKQACASHIAGAVQQALSTVDLAAIHELCRDIHSYDKIYACGLLKAQNAAIDLQVDLRMLGKQIYTDVSYADQTAHIQSAGKDELIIIFSYTGSYFDYTDMRAQSRHPVLPKIWMICGTERTLPGYVDRAIRFNTDGSRLSHPFQLESIASLIAQEYAVLSK